MTLVRGTGDSQNPLETASWTDPLGLRVANPVSLPDQHLQAFPSTAVPANTPQFGSPVSGPPGSHGRLDQRGKPDTTNTQSRPVPMWLCTWPILQVLQARETAYSNSLGPSIDLHPFDRKKYFCTSTHLTLLQQCSVRRRSLETAIQVVQAPVVHVGTFSAPGSQVFLVARDKRLVAGNRSLSCTVCACPPASGVSICFIPPAGHAATDWRAPRCPRARFTICNPRWEPEMCDPFQTFALSSLTISGHLRELKTQPENHAHPTISPSRCAVPTTLVDRRWSPSACHGHCMQMTGDSSRTGRFLVISHLRHPHTRWNEGISFAVFRAVSCPPSSEAHCPVVAAKAIKSIGIAECANKQVGEADCTVIETVPQYTPQGLERLHDLQPGHRQQSDTDSQPFRYLVRPRTCTKTLCQAHGESWIQR